jgi:hypothetical protein
MMMRILILAEEGSVKGVGILNLTNNLRSENSHLITVALHSIKIVIFFENI